MASLEQVHVVAGSVVAQGFLGNHQRAIHHGGADHGVDIGAGNQEPPGVLDRADHLLPPAGSPALRCRWAYAPPSRSIACRAAPAR